MEKEIAHTLIVSVASVLAAAIPAYLAILPQLKKKRNFKKEQESHLISRHPFFNRASVIKHHIDMTFTLDNKGKEIVFKDVLMNQIEIYKTSLMGVCEQIDRGEITTSHDLYNAHLELIDEMTYKHYHYYKNNDYYTAEEKTVLDRVMKKYVIWNQPKIEGVHDSLQAICQSPYYNDVYTQAAVIMDTYLGVMVNTLNEASITLGSINGDLCGLTFKGVTI